MIDRIFPRYKMSVIALCFLSWLLPTVYCLVWGKESTLSYIIFALTSILLIPVGYGMGMLVIGLMASNSMFSLKTVDQFCKFFFYLLGFVGILFSLALPVAWFLQLSPSDDYRMNGFLGGYGVAYAAYKLRKKYVLNGGKRS
jgi:hypothetical protein